MTTSFCKPFLLLCVGLVVACAETPDSATKDLVYDKNASNVAVLFGVPDNLPGVRTDMRELEALFKEPGYGLKVYSYIDKSPSEIAQLTGQHAKEVDANGTLLFYFSGHGAENGMLMAYGGMLDFANVAASIKQNRSAPLKRLLTVVDACFSGNLVDGRVAISNSGGPVTATGSQGFSPQPNRFDSGMNNGSGSPWAQAFGLSAFGSEREFRSFEQQYSEPLNDVTNANIFEALSPYAGSRGFGLQASTLYEQVLVLSSSRKTETSLDSASGGVFTTAFRGALAQMKNQPGAKIQDLVNATISQVTGYGHTPVYRAEPQEVVLGDLVFGSTTPPPATQATDLNTRSDANPSETDIVNPLTPPLFLALEEDQFGSSAIFVAAPQSVTEVTICRGSIDICQKSVQKDIVFKEFGGTTASGRMFVSRDRKVLQAGSYTILGLTSGLVANTKGFNLQAK